jgi:lysylphosphatidylglycerol synthetase-like protein (DUF2156 family)
MDRKVLALEIAGTLFIIFLGTALHFTFDFSGKNPFVGSFSAVNESVWEHLKLPFWPSLLWMLIEIYPLRKAVSNLFAAKAIGTIVMIVIIPAVFYAYTAFTEEILAVDIATFMIAVVVGQIISYRLYKKGKPSKSTEMIAIIVIVLVAIIFVAFTFYPPHLSIFQDSNTAQYGIASH